MDNSAAQSAAPRSASGWLNGLAGVVIFSGSLPATRLALQDFEPGFLTYARATLAAAVALVLLAVRREALPLRAHAARLAITACGVVVGFPLLTALALQHITAARSIVFLGLLPLATALFAVVRGGERPRPAFWLFSLAGSALVAGFALGQPAAASATGDLLMLAAVAVCGLGYAEGARLSRKLGGWQVICWALVVALPVMAAGAVYSLPSSAAAIHPTAWAALGYVSLFSMLIGFIFWYRGLAIGGIAAVGQLQLLQPLLGLMLSALLLHESIGTAMLATTAGVILCVAGAKRFA